MRRSCAAGIDERGVSPAALTKSVVVVEKHNAGEPARTFGKEAIAMARMHHFIGLAALSFMLTGCVTSTDKYTAVKLENEQLRQQLGESQSQARSAQAQADTLKHQIAAIMAGGGDKDALLKNNSDQIANLSAQLAEINAKYAAALDNVGR